MAMNLLDDILDFLHYHPTSGRADIVNGIAHKASPATVKRVLADGVHRGLVSVSGQGRATVYSITPKAHLLRTVNLDDYYAKDVDARQVQTGYNFALIRDEMPRIEIFSDDELAFLSDCERSFRQRMRDYPKELYDKEMERLGIDLSWKSSEIEGNTYTLLETVNLLKDSVEAKGKRREEAVMLLNHKAALKAIVERPDHFRTISLARLEDVHSVLIEGLGVDRSLRHVRVGISGTNYRPLDVESQIREAVEDACALVNGKSNAYEKALLTLLLVAYIQPFVDGNKRTSRLVANAILIAHGVCPVSFRTVSADDYRAALLLFYEQNNLSAFKRIFLDQVAFAVREYF